MLYWTLLLREGERGAGQKPSENAQLNHKVKIKYGYNSVIVVFFLINAQSCILVCQEILIDTISVNLNIEELFPNLEKSLLLYKKVSIQLTRSGIK